MKDANTGNYARLPPYNQAVVRALSFHRVLAPVALLAVLGALPVYPRPACAQSSATAALETAQRPSGKLLLVLPFENRTGQPSLDWIGEAAPEVFNQRLLSAGYTLIGRNDRQYALEHLGLPKTFQPSRATAVRLAQMLDTDYVVIGSYAEQGETFKASAQILDVSALRLGAPIVEQASLNHLLNVLNSLAWRVARTLDPKYAVAENTFVATGANLRLDGFENYIRGLLTTDPSDRIRRLKQAVEQNPAYSPAWLALGQAYFDDQQFEAAANAFGRLPKTDPNALQAEFYRGLAFFYTGSYPKAEEAFAFVATDLPLPEVVNNEGVVASRRGRDSSPYFQRAIAADPHDADYQFNLAVALDRKGDRRAALNAVNAALKLRPQDSEAQTLAASLHTPPAPAIVPVADTHGPTGSAATEAAAPHAEYLPLERIKRSFNDASFRQAASEIEQVEVLRLATLPPAERAKALAKEGQRYLDQGLLLEAERQFQAALQTDSASAAAHAGVAEVRQRNGDAEAARQEAEASLKLQPNATAYLVLAKLDMAASQYTAASLNADHALALDPANATGKSMKQMLVGKGQGTP